MNTKNSINTSSPILLLFSEPKRPYVLPYLKKNNSKDDEWKGNFPKLRLGIVNQYILNYL